MFKLTITSQTETKDITELVTSVTWSGSYKQAARQLEFAIAVSPTDEYLPRTNIALGNMVQFYTADGVERFRGYVFFKEKTLSGDEMQVTAYDGGVYLLKSKMTYNFKRMFPAQITQKVCAEVGIPVGELANPGDYVSFIADNQPLYDIIMQAYTHSAKLDGSKYMVVMSEGKLNVIRKGTIVAKYALSPEIEPDTTLLSNSTYTESLENAVTRVKVYDDKHNEIGIAENAEGVQNYGVLQEAYTKEKDKAHQTVAENILRGPERTAEVEVLGNIECVAGRAVIVREPYTGLDGLFYIDADEHTWEAGQHTMRLELNFKNMMDTREGE